MTKWRDESLPENAQLLPKYAWLEFPLSVTLKRGDNV